jgi:lipid-binding SYLF domain-containing protein
MKTKLIALASAAALAIGSITGCSTTSKPPDDTPAQKRQSIDAGVDAALAQLYAQDPAARELVAKARATLVFPSIVTAGFVLGDSYGKGALRVNGRNERYYKTARLGRPLAVPNRGGVPPLHDRRGARKFQGSNGWTAGADVGGDDEVGAARRSTARPCSSGDRLCDHEGRPGRSPRRDGVSPLEI